MFRDSYFLITFDQRWMSLDGCFTGLSQELSVDKVRQKWLYSTTTSTKYGPEMRSRKATHQYEKQATTTLLLYVLANISFWGRFAVNLHVTKGAIQTQKEKENSI